MVRDGRTGLCRAGYKNFKCVVRQVVGLDGNNAKLNVGLFGQYYLNAAELLRCTDAGWRQEDVEQFERMLRTVYYPTIRDFFTEANGNWDASMICTMMCMGVFLEDHDMFNRAVERFYRGNGNGGITRYIYPGGQCQETTRDWDHVQLGLGELSRAARWPGRKGSTSTRWPMTGWRRGSSMPPVSCRVSRCRPGATYPAVRRTKYATSTIPYTITMCASRGWNCPIPGR